MKRIAIVVLLCASTFCHAELSNNQIVDINNISNFDAKVKIIEADLDLNCSDKLTVNQHSRLSVNPNQVHCARDLYRIKAYRVLEANSKTSSVFQKGAVCTISTNKAWDTRFSISCTN